MRKLRTAAVLAAFMAVRAALAPAAPQPKLVLVVVVDQFRYDYLTRFRGDYHAGLDRLLSKGAVFTNARYEHFPTVTAVGHSAILTGATPSMSGIVGNDWYDRASGKVVTSVSDETVQALGGGEGASPRRLLVSTLGDELRMAHAGSKAIGISLKDRSAILPAGHMANGAYWFDVRTGNFVSSTFYFASLPDWVQQFNGERPADRFKGAHWLDRALPDQTPAVYAAMEGSPFGNDLVESFAERAVQAEQLGRRNTTDLLTISFSANDYVGHAVGPDAPEVKEMSLETDRVLGKLFGYLDNAVGTRNVLVVMTADHGVAPLPETQAERKMPGGRLAAGTVTKAVQSALAAKFGEGKWILGTSDYALYFNRDLMRDKKLDEAEIERVAADAARAVAHVFRVYTRGQLETGVAMEGQVGRRMLNGFYGPRSADLYVLLEPYWLMQSKGTTHGTTFSYDAHVPVIFLGAGIKQGRFDGQIAVNDIAPTLATYLDVETPSGSTGRCLAEIFADE